MSKAPKKQTEEGVVDAPLAFGPENDDAVTRRLDDLLDPGKLNTSIDQVNDLEARLNALEASEGPFAAMEGAFGAEGIIPTGILGEDKKALSDTDITPEAESLDENVSESSDDIDEDMDEHGSLEDLVAKISDDPDREEDIDDLSDEVLPEGTVDSIFDGLPTTDASEKESLEITDPGLDDADIVDEVASEQVEEEEEYDPLGGLDEDEVADEDDVNLFPEMDEDDQEIADMLDDEGEDSSADTSHLPSPSPISDDDQMFMSSRTSDDVDVEDDASQEDDDPWGIGQTPTPSPMSGTDRKMFGSDDGSVDEVDPSEALLSDVMEESETEDLTSKPLPSWMSVDEEDEDEMANIDDDGEGFEFPDDELQDVPLEDEAEDGDLSEEEDLSDILPGDDDQDNAAQESAVDDILSFDEPDDVAGEDQDPEDNDATPTDNVDGGKKKSRLKAALLAAAAILVAVPVGGFVYMNQTGHVPAVVADVVAGTPLATVLPSITQMPLATSAEEPAVITAELPDDVIPTQDETTDDLVDSPAVAPEFLDTDIVEVDLNPEARDPILVQVDPVDPADVSDAEFMLDPESADIANNNADDLPYFEQPPLVALVDEPDITDVADVEGTSESEPAEDLVTPEAADDPIIPETAFDPLTAEAVDDPVGGGLATSDDEGVEPDVDARGSEDIADLEADRLTGGLEDLVLEDGETDVLNGLNRLEGALEARDQADEQVVSAPDPETIRRIDALEELTDQMSSAVGDLNESIDLLTSRLAELAETDVNVEGRLSNTERLVRGQTAMLSDFVKMQESLEQTQIVLLDISGRVGEIEKANPADRDAVNAALSDIEDRLETLSANMSIMARMAVDGVKVLKSGGVSSIDDGVQTSGSPAVSGNPVYGESDQLTLKEAPEKAIPKDVAKGDFINGYGTVLEVIPASGGQRLVIMENGSVLIPE